MSGSAEAASVGALTGKFDVGIEAQFACLLSPWWVVGQIRRQAAYDFLDLIFDAPVTWRLAR